MIIVIVKRQANYHKPFTGFNTEFVSRTKITPKATPRATKVNTIMIANNTRILVFTEK